MRAPTCTSTGCDLAILLTLFLVLIPTTYLIPTPLSLSSIAVGHVKIVPERYLPWCKNAYLHVKSAHDICPQMTECKLNLAVGVAQRLQTWRVSSEAPTTSNR